MGGVGGKSAGSRPRTWGGAVRAGIGAKRRGIPLVGKKKNPTNSWQGGKKRQKEIKRLHLLTAGEQIKIRGGGIEAFLNREKFPKKLEKKGGVDREVGGRRVRGSG